MQHGVRGVRFLGCPVPVTTALGLNSHEIPSVGSRLSRYLHREEGEVSEVTKDIFVLATHLALPLSLAELGKSGGSRRDGDPDISNWLTKVFHSPLDKYTMS